MKKNILAYSGLIVTLFVFSTCQTIGLNSPKNNINLVKYGTSFGHCMGINCNKTFTISTDEVSYTKRSNGESSDSLIRRTEIETEQWDNLINAINDSGLKKLPETIGCPDCADGGSEWLEISEDNKKTRVTFEYGKTPDEIKAVVRILKRLSEPFREEK